MPSLARRHESKRVCHRLASTLRIQSFPKPSAILKTQIIDVNSGFTNQIVKEQTETVDTAGRLDSFRQRKTILAIASGLSTVPIAIFCQFQPTTQITVCKSFRSTIQYRLPRISCEVFSRLLAGNVAPQMNQNWTRSAGGSLDVKMGYVR